MIYRLAIYKLINILMQNSKDKIIKLIEKYGRKVEKSVRLCNGESTHSHSYSCIGKCHYTQ